ncbi:HAMP domain-containing sensor histidine kinase [Lewinella sp. W8]|uniref:sensor histidine kinase n=1 Tax=Lewinella sp. W8 TaxID=2528208 RepID=UPI001068B150|nr:HAMP domain-containing sensor histidine kinase [Lewinella sp. W8]MTB52106.1 hypothetical protein [Lewinella sp. W8]
MTKRTQSLSFLITGSLLGIFLLQVYFGYQVYQKHRLTIQRELTAALDEAIDRADARRISTINDLFARDLRDPELVRLEIRVEEDQPKVFIISPQTGDIHVSIFFPDLVDSVAAVQQMEEQILERNRALLVEGSIMYWTDELGKRLITYSDSIQISRETLRTAVARELDSLDIRSAFSLVLEHDSLAAVPDESLFFQHQRLPAKVEGNNLVSILLAQPALEVFRRAGLVFLMTLIILLLMVAGFWWLLKLARREARLSRLKDDFIDNVTHELLTPIATLKLALATLREDNNLPKPNKYLAMSEQQAQRIAEVVDHVLKVTFVDQQQAGITLERVNPNAILTEVISYYENHAGATITVLPAKDIEVDTDPHHLQNVFHNLVSNALKYGPEHPELTVRVKTLPQSVTISFTDNGPGIPPSERDSIFEKFHRISEGGTHDVKGLGIGLYYARGILRQLGGNLELTRSTAAGSTFTVTLPTTEV